MTDSFSKKEEKISRIFRVVLHSYEIAAKIEFVNFISEYYQVHSVQSYIHICYWFYGDSFEFNSVLTVLVSHVEYETIEYQ